MKILLVDDHAMFAESIRLLFRCTHRVTTVNSGTDALTQVSQERPDAVLLDQALPDVDGLTLIKLIRALPSPPPVLLLSGNNDPKLIASARESGAAGYLHKSSNAEALLDAVAQILQGHDVWPANTNQPSETVGAPQYSQSVNRRLIKELGITDRQYDVLALMVSGLPNKTIANNLGIAESTVKSHMKSLFHTLKVSNRVACHNKARELGIL